MVNFRMERTRVELVTSSMPLKRATNCANAPYELFISCIPYPKHNINIIFMKLFFIIFFIKYFIIKYFNMNNKINDILKKPDGIIAFPTDTVWGIGCLVENKNAVERIYSIKERSKKKPLIILGSKIEHLVPYVSMISETAWKIIYKYLPGAVTLVFPKSEKTPHYLTSGGNTIGIRIPDSPPIIEFLEKSVKNHVLATTSANISNEKPGLSKSDVLKNLGDKVDYILDDCGFKAKGTESTVILIDSNDNIKILRQGAVLINIS